MKAMLFKVNSLRFIGIAEGISFLLLLVIAMPLKYFFGFPEAVKVIGWAHGGLFILYIVAVLVSIRAMQWGLIDIGIALIVSLLPAGTFFLERSWRKRADEIRLTTVQVP